MNECCTQRLFGVAQHLSPERRPYWAHQGRRWPSIAAQVGFKPGGALVHFGSGAQFAFNNRSRLYDRADPAGGLLSATTSRNRYSTVTGEKATLVSEIAVRDGV